MILRRLLLSFLTFALFFAGIIGPTPIYAAPPTDFQTTQVIGSGLFNPTGLGIAPDGRIFITEQAGRVLIYKNNQLLSQPFTILPASGAGGDLGLLGIAFDPNFNSNHYVYFYYTTDAGHNRVVRMDASGDTASGGATVIYETPGDVQEYHAGGTMQFGPDGKIYLSNGDNGYAAHSQSLSNPFGKILRINPNGTIPSDNPFVGQSGRLPEIWAFGLRNPFRFQFDNLSGKLYLGDVGAGAWEEVNVITKGGNYGWASCEGTCGTGMVNPIHTYSHSGGSASITGGFVYRGSMFPSAYQGRYFFADYAKNFIKTLTFDGSGDVTGSHNFDMDSGTTVDMKQAPDGSVYYINIYPAAMYRITYSTSNHVPEAQSSASETDGDEPLIVQFSSAGSNDPDGSPVTYLWDFGDGTTSTQASPSKTYTEPGRYSITLTVSDGTLQAQAPPLTVQVGTPPEITIAAPLEDALYSAGETISYSASAVDGDGNTLGASAFTTDVVFHHQTHTHPFLGPLEETRSGELTIPQDGENSAETWYVIQFTVEDADGLISKKSVKIVPRTVTLNFQTDPPGKDLFIDSQPVTTPYSVDRVVGFKTEVNVPAIQLVGSTYYQFDSWSDGGTQRHFITTPATGTSYTAILRETPPFTATYYNNVNLSGTPVLTRQEGIPDYDWQSNSPHASVNSDNFSARWIKEHYFKSGSYTFETESDDGVRLFIDGDAIIDKWIDQGSTLHSATVALTEGDHEIKLEYYERGGGANVKLNWDAAGGPGGPTPPAGQSITSFTLVNADLDLVIASYDPIPAGTTLDLATLPTKNLNIRANTAPGTVGSVRFGYDGNANYQTETNAPYALASDNGGNYLPWTPTVGAHTVTAMPYTGANGGGTAGTPLTLNFTITNSGTPTPAAQAVTSFTLINANTEQPIAGFDPIPADATLNLATLPTKNLNVRSNTTPGTVGSVRFGYDGNTNFGTENNSPYALASDNDGNYNAWTPTVGAHSVTATPYTGPSAGGTAGTALTLSINVTDSGGTTPTPTPTLAPTNIPTPTPTSTPGGGSGQSVTTLTLINADTEQPIAAFNPFTNGATLDLSSLPTTNLNVRADTTPGTVGSVRFALDGNANFRTEGYAPYALAGDDDSNYISWTPSVGSHTLIVTPYTGANASGTAGTPITVEFEVQN